MRCERNYLKGKEKTGGEVREVSRCSSKLGVLKDVYEDGPIEWLMGGEGTL
jgi:hypothetical protein